MWGCSEGANKEEGREEKCGVRVGRGKERKEQEVL